MRRSATPKMHPVVHLLANVLALALLVAALVSRHATLALGGIALFIVYCAVESWTVSRHRRDLIG
jgi:hypothetical protein